MNTHTHTLTEIATPQARLEIWQARFNRWTPVRVLVCHPSGAVTVAFPENRGRATMPAATIARRPAIV